MRIRFHQTCSSGNPDFPFQAGQVIEVPRLTPEMRAAVESAAAELLTDEPELAMQGPPAETAQQPRGRTKGSR